MSSNVISLAGAALVTGGALRLGAAIADRLASLGLDVAIHCNRSRDEAQETADRLVRDHGVRACVIAKDLADEDVGSLVRQAGILLGRSLTVLVNSASVYEGDSLETVAAGEFDRHMNVNARAPILLMSAFSEQAPEGSCVVNLLDQRVLRPTPQFFSYSLSKDLLHAATMKAAQALSGKGIRVNGVAPGLTLPNPSQDVEEYQRRIDKLPLRRGGCPDEVAAAVAFLVTGAPSVTGQVIAIDGGQHLAFDLPDVA